MTHVLIVEDREADRKLLKMLLERNGYRVTTAVDGLEALAAARRDRPDAIVSDVLMPKMDGFALCRAWMQDAGLKTIPFIFYSATLDHVEDRQFAMKLGAARYLIKPLETEAFLQELRTVLQEYAGHVAFAPDSSLDDDTSHALHESALGRAIEDKITQLETANCELREGEVRYRQLFEANPHPMWVFDLETLAFLAVNDAAVEHYGWSRDEFLAMTLADIRPTEGIPALLEALATDNEKSIRFVASSKHRKKDGTLIDVEISSHVVDFDGRRARVASADDITERIRAEAEIKHYIEQIKTALMSTVKVVTTLSELRDPYTTGHEQRVADIAVAIGTELGLDDGQLEGLRVAGHLHDVGKITIPSEILSKPGKLSTLEYQMIQLHSQAGYDVLKGVEFPWPVAQIALQHHERMDGSGYPQGLKGEAILFEARVMAVADVVEAMSSHRPYRPGLGIENALAEIDLGSGSKYDPVIAKACLKLFREKGYKLPA